MKVKFGLLVCCIMALASCSEDSQVASNKASTKITANAIPDKAEQLLPVSTVPPTFLDQGWDKTSRLEWWYTHQGSRILPSSWFFALEHAESEQLISSPESLAQYRFINWPPDASWNWSGLPIGLVVEKKHDTGARYFGITCAACHTSKITYKREEFLVDGAPAHHDFDRFLGDIAAGMQKTVEDSDKFARFAYRAFGANATTNDIAALKIELREATKKFAARTHINTPSYPHGFGRMDWFGRLFNELSVFALNQPDNAKLVNAPVSYPVLWDTPHHDVVQWTGLLPNAGIGPFLRNAGYVVGLFGDLRINLSNVGNVSEVVFDHHVQINNLAQLESILVRLKSPLWPEQLPAIDKIKAERGRDIYQQHCVSCHAVLERDNPERKIIAKMVPVSEIGTDPVAAMNIAAHTSKTGMIAGQSVLALDRFVADLDKFGPESSTFQIMLYGVTGVLADSMRYNLLYDGLPDFLEASQKAMYTNQCSKPPASQCRREPSYKARPLNGVWASGPYLHNGSVPNLWQLLQKPRLRIAAFYTGSWEFDPVYVGFNISQEPASTAFYTSLPGNSNQGHDYGTNLSDHSKWDLIEYLKTL